MSYLIRKKYAGGAAEVWWSSGSACERERECVDDEEEGWAKHELLYMDARISKHKNRVGARNAGGT
ncbi:hypothetical protein DRN79_05260 [Methanosarcinales archaeon]|nr:MAG: hypothetical protein DRN79_05260 [Methanosarcinales archaeon]